jgi:outer membrane protein OmpA-like peptidoglycan-associated protein
MARNRLNPWPAVADLFSALSVVAFAALIVVALGAVILTKNEQIERNAAQELAHYFEENYRTQSGLAVRVASCEDRKTEECIDIPFRFVRNKSELSDQGRTEVGEACQIYRRAVDFLLERMRAQNVTIDKSNLILIIEGHTDSTIPPGIANDRERFLFNWKLSSERAASVLYEFRECGVSPETGYPITSVGLAATSQVCKDAQPQEGCHEQNRRTTMRIRVIRGT